MGNWQVILLTPFRHGHGAFEFSLLLDTIIFLYGIYIFIIAIIFIKLQ